MKKFARTLLFMALVMGLYAATASHAQTPPAKALRLTTIRVGIIPIAAIVPLFAAIDKGYFEEEGLKVEAVPMAGGTHILPAIAGGSVDIGFTALPSVIIANDKGFDFKIITHNNSNNWTKTGGPIGYRASDAIMVRAESPIQGAKDLEGKKVAVNTLNNISWLMASEWLEMRGANPARVTWVEMPFPNMGAALFSGTVDAIHASEPFTTILLSRGGVRVLDYHFTAVRPEAAIACYVGSGAWIEKNASIVERFVRAHTRGIEYVNSHPGERGDIIARHIRLPADLASRMMHYKYESRVTPEEVRWWSDLIMKYRLIDRPADPAQILYGTARPSS